MNQIQETTKVIERLMLNQSLMHNILFQIVLNYLEELENFPMATLNRFKIAIKKTTLPSI